MSAGLSTTGETDLTLDGATLVFDLDGTLVDTAPDLIGTLNAMLAEEGLTPVPLAAARHLVGRGARHLLEHGFREAGLVLAPSRADVLTERFVALYRGRIADESRPFEGLVEALDALEAAGARFSVCTNKRTDLSLALLDALDLLPRFRAVLGPDAVERKKPDAGHFLRAVADAGGDPARALMIGDSETDVLTARAAGAPVVVTAFGYTEIPPADLGGDWLMERYADLPDAALRLLPR